MCLPTNLSKISTTVALPKMAEQDLTKNKVRFEETVTVNMIESHYKYTSSECLSVWYTKAEYRSFNLEETRELLSGPISMRKEKRRRSMRIDNVRYLVLQAQSVRLMQKKRNTTDDYSTWLADFYSHHSKPCALAARQRGIENDLDLLNIKLRTASSTMLKRSTLFNKLNVSNTNSKGSKNARWSEDDSSDEGTYGQAKRFKDVAPNAVKSSRNLRRELCKDLDLNKKMIGNPSDTNTFKPIDRRCSSGQKEDRWSAAPSKNGRRKVAKRDIPLKPMSHSISPPSSTITIALNVKSK